MTFPAVALQRERSPSKSSTTVPREKGMLFGWGVPLLLSLPVEVLVPRGVPFDFVFVSVPGEAVVEGVCEPSPPPSDGPRIAEQPASERVVVVPSVARNLRRVDERLILNTLSTG